MKGFMLVVTTLLLAAVNTSCAHAQAQATRASAEAMLAVLQNDLNTESIVSSAAVNLGSGLPASKPGWNTQQVQQYYSLMNQGSGYMSTGAGLMSGVAGMIQQGTWFLQSGDGQFQLTGGDDADQATIADYEDADQEWGMADQNVDAATLNYQRAYQAYQAAWNFWASN